MSLSSSSSDPEAEVNLLKSVLPPLLDDFQYWFGHSLKLVETERLGFLPDEAQADLRSRLQTALCQVNVAKTLAAATDTQAGIEMPVVMGWHQLLHECWGVAIKHRQTMSAPLSEPEAFNL